MLAGGGGGWGGRGVAWVCAGLRVVAGGGGARLGVIGRCWLPVLVAGAGAACGAVPTALAVRACVRVVAACPRPWLCVRRLWLCVVW